MLPRAVFSEGDAARPITASQPPGAHARLASITGQGWRGRSSLGACTHKSTTLIDVRLAPTSGEKANFFKPPLCAISRHSGGQHLTRPGNIPTLHAVSKSL